MTSPTEILLSKIGWSNVQAEWQPHAPIAEAILPPVAASVTDGGSTVVVAYAADDYAPPEFWKNLNDGWEFTELEDVEARNTFLRQREGNGQVVFLVCETIHGVVEYDVILPKARADTWRDVICSAGCLIAPSELQQALRVGTTTYDQARDAAKAVLSRFSAHRNGANYVVIVEELDFDRESGIFEARDARRASRSIGIEDATKIAQNLVAERCAPSKRHGGPRRPQIPQ